MSINTMTSNAVRRIVPNASTPNSKGLGVAEDAPLPTNSTPPLGETNILPDNSVSNVLGALIVYIPTEVITLYVAAIAAAPVLTMGAEIMYWGFAIFTPIFALLVFLSKAITTAGRDAPLPSLSQFPWWSMLASTIAFLVWALAMPDAPYVGENGNAIAGLGALFVSTILSVLEPIALRFFKA